MQSSVALVRPFVPDDAAFVRDAAVEAFAEYDGADAAARTLTRALERGTCTMVATRDGRSAGFVIVAVRGREAHLNAIAVVSAFRTVGIGKQLLRAAEQHAKAEGATAMRLETGEANLGAIDLFVRAGFVRVGRIPRYYRTGYDALVFRKLLVPLASSPR